MLVFHQHPEGRQPRGLAARAGQQVRAGAHEVESPAVEAHVVQVPRRLAATEAVGVTTQETVLDAAALSSWAALRVAAAHLLGGGVTGAAPPAILIGPHLLAGRERAALEVAAAGRGGNAGAAAGHEAREAHAALDARARGAVGRHRGGVAGGRAGGATELVAAVGRAGQGCGDTGAGSGQHSQNVPGLPSPTQLLPQSSPSQLMTLPPFWVRRPQTSEI